MELNEIVKNIKEEPKLFIRFHAKWCGVCKLIAPFVSKMKDDERFQDVKFIDVDVDDYKDVKQAFKIDNLPYFAAFRDGKLIEEFNTSKKDKLEETLEKVVA
jgi:thioredoxin-like negative regulator of GroEL